MSDAPLPVMILGSTGYVAGELLRLLAGHPGMALRAAVSTSRAGTSLAATFPFLAGAYPGVDFAPPEAIAEAIASEDRMAAFAALPHGESATRVAALLDEAAAAGCAVSLVDLSADFRHPDASLYEATYGAPHGAPAALARFTCELPDLARETPAGPVAHPGCFTTAVSLACRPFVALDLAEPRFFASAVTGSTGSGRTPRATTHFPERSGNMFAYKPLTHRHRPEMERLVGGGSDPAPEVLFVPHSGPFSRGIHATVHVRLREPRPTADLVAALGEFYAPSPFVEVRDAPPTLKEVVGTNRCVLGVTASGRDAVVFSAIDNLTKGAAGGALQWMNRLVGLPETAGLDLAPAGWC